jgi:hypothetical protein
MRNWEQGVEEIAIGGMVKKIAASNRPADSGSFGMVCGAQARQPAAYVTAIGFVVWAEGSAESGLLVGQYEEVSGEKEEAGISQKRPRLVKERRAGERESCAEVHGISYETVGAANHEAAGRIERRRSAFADRGEGVDAPQRDGRACGSKNHPSDLRDCDCRGADNARPRQDAGREVDEQETDKESRESDGPDKNKHDCPIVVTSSKVNNVLPFFNLRGSSR